MLFKEGTAINKSLLFLGIVISALSRGLRCVPLSLERHCNDSRTQPPRVTVMRHSETAALP